VNRISVDKIDKDVVSPEAMDEGNQECGPQQKNGEPKAQVYSHLKAFAFPDRLAALREDSLAAPVNIRIKPINHCNHNCWYCAYRVDNLQLGEDIDYSDVIPKDKMFEIVDNVIEMGVAAVTFSGGGEPLIYKPIADVVERLAQGGVRIGCLTNGANLKGRIADVFAEHGTWVRISLDGWDGKSYADARGIKVDAFDKLVRNMKEFTVRKPKCVLGTSLIIGKNNFEHVFEICDLLKSAGVKHVKLSAAVVSNDGAVSNNYHRPIKERVLDEIEKAKTLENSNFRILNHYHDLAERFDKPYHTCPVIQFIPVIGADCKVYTCQDKAYTQSGTLGSIEKQSFKDFWFSEENRQRVFSLDPNVHCPHHCTGHAKNLAIHNFLATDPEHLLFV